MLVWEKQIADTSYELRVVGNSQRLYTNGVFHSQYRADHFLNGGVWDLLWLPLFFRAPSSIKKVLVLGLGSGAALAKILKYFPSAKAIAVDIDPQHIEVARRFTQLDEDKVRLVQADAIDWLSQGKDQYDVIIDDLFGHHDSEPVRAIELHEGHPTWAKQLKNRLRADGLLIINGLSTPDVGFIRTRRGGTSSRFKSAYTFRQSSFSNVVSVFSDQILDRADYRSHLEAVAGSREGRGSLRQLSSMTIRRRF